MFFCLHQEPRIYDSVNDRMTKTKTEKEHGRGFLSPGPDFQSPYKEKIITIKKKSLFVFMATHKNVYMYIFRCLFNKDTFFWDFKWFTLFLTKDIVYP